MSPTTLLVNASPYGGFPKLRVPFWGVPIKRTIIYWGLWGTLILGNYHITLRLQVPKRQLAVDRPYSLPALERGSKTHRSSATRRDHRKQHAKKNGVLTSLITRMLRTCFQNSTCPLPGLSIDYFLMPCWATCVEHTHTHTHPHTHTHTRANTHTHTHTRANTHTHTHTHTWVGTLPTQASELVGSYSHRITYSHFHYYP